MINDPKLLALNNPRVLSVVEKYSKICKPAQIIVCDDSKEDANLVREAALKNGEEHPLAMEGHTYHYDGPLDQGRDKAHTRLLLSSHVDFGFETLTMNRQEGIDEIMEILDGIMAGKAMYVRFFCLGPVHSEFSIKALQITDSAYVAHAEDMLYRKGYEEFKNADNKDDFLIFIHSAGELKNGITQNIDKRRIYIDLDEETVFSVNNQYAGNSLGLKKLAFRLAIARAHKSNWLAEHMFLMGVHGKPGRTTYFSGAFPSACGKTSTAMLPGQHMVGDDIIYARPRNGIAYAVNVEKGVFGIIENVNAKDDPCIFEALMSPGELIFSDVLISKDLKPYWVGMNVEPPEEGLHYLGYWKKGDRDANGKPIEISHKNARYMISCESLANCDPSLHNPDGVPLEGIIYGGRDSDTSVPVVESLSWAHGAFLGACLESETTAATIGQQGVRKHNPYANLDFMTVPLPQYFEDHLKFARQLKKAPKVFQTNYFLKNDKGEFLNHKLDKLAWVLWAEARVHGEVDAIETPVGLIPKYEDLKPIFASALHKEYTVEEYNEQFRIRLDAYLQKFKRMQEIFSKITMPAEFTAELNAQLERLNKAR